MKFTYLNILKPAKTSTWYFHKILFQLLALNYHFRYNNKDYTDDYSLPQSLPHQTLSLVYIHQKKYLGIKKKYHYKKLGWGQFAQLSLIQNIHRYGICYLYLLLWFF